MIFFDALPMLRQKTKIRKHVDMPKNLTTIAFDADDTLWENQKIYDRTQAHMMDLLKDYVDYDAASGQLLETEKKNLRFYGYGAKGFALSMIETALDITNDDVDPAVIRKIINLVHEMYDHPIDPLPHVRETLEAVGNDHRLIVITKGDLFDQERKVAQSGLGEYFDAVEIVSEKHKDIYDRIFKEQGGSPETSMMVGNSLKSDILPALDVGSWGIYVPHTTTWAMERAEEPESAERYHKLSSIAQLNDVLAGI